MGFNWTREIPFVPQDKAVEKWRFYNGEITNEYEVETTYGKELDTQKLKKKVQENLDEKIRDITMSREEFFSKNSNLTTVKSCPICSSDESYERLKVHNAQYVECKRCSHFYLSNMPTESALTEFYRNNDNYQETYADKKTSEIRVSEVAKPKAEWVINHFRQSFNREPRGILDVGAGSGHFVKACRDLGVRADGIEVSDKGRNFSNEFFDIELDGRDFTEHASEFSNYEIVTFWGVIEHVPDPLSMLESAKIVLESTESFVVSEVPRWECISTAMQSLYPEKIIRHLEPMGHINCFSDRSLATAYESLDLAPRFAWYFGMDAYEMVTLINTQLGEKTRQEFMDVGSELLNGLQIWFDKARLSDEIVLIGSPLEMGE